LTNIFVGQSALRVSVRTGTALVDVASCEIRYEKPDGSRGGWSAFVSDPNRGVISHDLLGNELDQAGWWRFWVYVRFNDERASVGDVTKVFVRKEGM
jgi:hypothetical protein